MMTTPSCETCRYWVRLHEGNVGDCRKNPPTFIKEGTPYNMRVWPNTYDIDFCGKYKTDKEKYKSEKEDLKQVDIDDVKPSNDDD